MKIPIVPKSLVAFEAVRTDVLLFGVDYFLDGWEVFLGCVEMIHRHLVHRDVHYGAVGSVPLIAYKVGRAHRRRKPLLLGLFLLLENGWQ
jgi:hypothetical protein